MQSSGTRTAVRARTPRALAAGAVLAIAALVAGGCGDDAASTNGEEEKSATQILEDATAATTDATFHLAGELTSDNGTLALDLVLSPERGGGSITLNGTELEIVRAGETVYLQGSRSTWESLTGNADVAQLVADQWVQAPATNENFSGLAQLVDLAAFIESLTPDGEISKGEVTETSDGRDAIELVDSTDDRLLVALTGEPYVLELVNASDTADEPGRVTLDEYGSAEVPEIPADAVDLMKLQGG